MEVGGEIDVAHRDAGLANRIAERHRDQFQMGEQASAFLRRQGGEQVVLAGVMRAGHGPSPKYLSQLE